MRRPRRRVLGLTWLGWVNFLLMQWIGLRFTLALDETEKVVGTGISAAWPLCGWKFIGWGRGPHTLFMWERVDGKWRLWRGHK